MKIRGRPVTSDARAWWIVSVLIALAPGLAPEARAQASRPPAGQASILVDGTDWMDASSQERRAFLMGVGNMIVAETAYAKHQQLATPPASDRIVAAVKEMKLGEIEDRITGWYEANPSKRSFPVMGVIWQHIVKQRP